jgi:membrane protein implicated in regulation of membrane protease activity
VVLLGVVSMICGAALLAAEAHVTAGFLGVTGTVALAVGIALAIAGAGGGLALVLAGVAAAALVAVAWVGLIARSVLRTRTQHAVSGREGLSGRLGVVRAWSGANGGQVLVDGALWRARASVLEQDAPHLNVGDPVVVERVRGLTLTVRRAEEWEEES